MHERECAPFYAWMRCPRFKLRKDKKVPHKILTNIPQPKAVRVADALAGVRRRERGEMMVRQAKLGRKTCAQQRKEGKAHGKGESSQ